MRLGRLTAVLLTVLAIGGAGVAVAASLTGTPAAKQLASRVLATARRTPSLTLVSHGGLFECPGARSPQHVFSQRSAARGCRPLTVINQENLVRGLIAATAVRTSAPGFPVVTTIVDRYGAWRSTQTSGCFRFTGRVPRVPPFTYAGERLSIIGRHGDTVELQGVGAYGSETDLVDAHSAVLRTLRVTGPAIHHGKSTQVTTVRYLRATQTLPEASPRCTGQPDLYLSSSTITGGHATVSVTPDFRITPLIPLRSSPNYVLYAAYAPFSHYVEVASANGLSADSLPIQFPNPQGGLPPTRNFRIYAVGDLHRSQTLTQLVYPETELNISATRGRVAGLITYAISIHPLSHYPRARVYLYARAHGARAFVLVGSPLLHVHSSAFPGAVSLRASVRFRPGPFNGDLIACLQRNIVSDMGLPFHDRLCGVPSSTREP